jgi:hypothetical protein
MFARILGFYLRELELAEKLWLRLRIILMTVISFGARLLI